MAGAEYYGRGTAIMTQNELVSVFVSILNTDRVLAEEPMSNHTTFKTGGNAELLLVLHTEEELKAVLEILEREQLPYTLIGRGSNLLVSDEGLPGVVLKLADGFDEVCVREGGLVYAQAGATLRSACLGAIHAGLSGLEFAGGIPGCVGGGVAMNAGAYGGELKDVVEYVRILTPARKVQTLTNEQMRFSYRKSAVQGSGSVILGAAFRLQPGDRDQSMETFNCLNARRKEKQPLNFPSAGSTFKRPQGNYASALIDQCNLKGFTIGGAQVSEKHAGFIINLGNASSRDIYELICYVRQEVMKKTGILLEPEVRLLGEF